MQLDWLSWTNPVAIWWCFLLVVSATNITFLLFLFAHMRKTSVARRAAAFAVEPLLLLCAAYVLGCAFRSMLPRADVQDLPVRHLALERLRGPVRGHGRGNLFRRSVGDRSARARANSERGYGAKYLEDNRSTHRSSGGLFLVCGDHHELFG